MNCMRRVRERQLEHEVLKKKIVKALNELSEITRAVGGRKTLRDIIDGKVEITINKVSPRPSVPTSTVAPITPNTHANTPP